MIPVQEMKLEPKSDSFKLWKDPPIPLKFDVYLYNWTNPRNLTEDDFEKPILQQIGPYRFTEITNKTKIRWHPKNQTISYRRRSVYHFDPEGSVGRLDDLITTVNVVALVRIFVLNLISCIVICVFIFFFFWFLCLVSRK